jgi:S1-C subfamily serine protease
MILKRFIAPIFIMGLFLLVFGCVSIPGEKSVEVVDLDKKIAQEFDSYIRANDFYNASNSFIEFLECCDGDKKDEMLSKLTDLLRAKIDEKRETNDRLGAINDIYSYINLVEGVAGEDQVDEFKGELNNYLRDFISTDLKEKGDLEKASWILYLSHFFFEDPFPYKLLTEIFVGRNNPLLASKYAASFSETVANNDLDGYEEEIAELNAQVEELVEKRAQDTDIFETAIGNTIKSSVKIIVDKGIKTENRVGIPDQVLGTGIVIDNDGYLITNHHIIESSVDPKYEGYSKVYVIPGDDDNVRFNAKIIGYDPIYDLALLKIEDKVESYIRFGDSGSIRQGEKVVAIGNPVGLTNTVTSGVVSSLDRPFLQIGNIIQIDAALNPGNSGGALIDEDGYLVGVAFAGLENFENLNFAIPSNLLLSLLFRLYGGGEVERSWTGLAVEERGDNLTIEYIVPEGPAGPARLSEGDIIRAVNKKPVSSLNDIQSLLSTLSNPIIVNLTIERNNKTYEKSILLGKRPDTPSIYIYNHDAHENIITPLFGIVAKRVDPARQKSYLVSRILAGSVANSVGITEGDIIKMRSVKYDEENRYFFLPIELKSKRFGYINKNMVLYSPADINIFI